MRRLGRGSSSGGPPPETGEGISSFDELSVLTAKSPEFTVICLALELAAGDAGHALNLDCD